MLVRLLSFVLLLTAPAAGWAQSDLPPVQPQIAFTAEYRIESNRGGRFQWGQRRVTVSDTLSRDELLDGDIDRSTVLADRARGVVLRFDPDDPARLARRLPWDDHLVSPMALGLGVMLIRLGPPRSIGQRQIAGHSCTRLVWEMVGEKLEWCVTGQGLVLAARSLAGVNETKLEVLSLRLDPPDPGLFALPPGFTAQD